MSWRAWLAFGAFGAVGVAVAFGYRGDWLRASGAAVFALVPAGLWVRGQMARTRAMLRMLAMADAEAARDQAPGVRR